MVTLTPMQWILIATHGVLLTTAIGYRTSLIGEEKAHDATRVELTRTQLTAETLKGSVLKQNLAIATMKNEQATAEAAATQALTLAQAETKTARRKAAELLARPQPQGVDSCTAAAALFDGEMYAN